MRNERQKAKGKNQKAKGCRHARGSALLPFAFCLLSFAFESRLTAQSSGLITGAVQDASGAVVPGASVRAVNERTGLEWKCASDEAGRWSFPRLPVGDYRIDVSHAGFRRFVSESFHLDADQNRHVAVALELGQTSESVTVTGAVAQVDTVGATLKEVVDQKRMTELPLNGRNPVQLVLLVPGVVPGPGATNLNQNDGLAINGSRAVSTNYMLDGGDNNDPQQNVPAIVPNPDALEEFSVLTNNFSAEYGRNSGGAVNAVTRSGANQFHGSAYEFLRNDAMDARSFFGIEKGKLRRNQFGGTLGGPVVRKRTFFFGAYEAVRQRLGATFSSLVVPTAAERSGDFSASARKPNDPATGRAFADNVIPASRFDPASVRFLSDMEVPLPNASGGRYIFNRPDNLDSNQEMGRLDHSLSDKQRLTGRVFKNSSRQFVTAGLPSLHSDSKFDNWNITGQHTYTIRSSLLAVGQFTFNRTNIDRGPLPVGSGDGVTYQSMGVKASPGPPPSAGKFVTNFRGQVTGFWNLNQDNLATIDRRTYQGTYQIAWTRSAHLVKFGGEYRYSSSDRVTCNLCDPQFNFTGQFSGYAFADFLLGLPANLSQGSLRVNAIRANAYALYLQDDYKLRPNLTLSLGVRWEPFLPFYSAADELTVFRAGMLSKVFPNAPAGLAYMGDAGIPRGGTRSDWNNLAPRASLAWSPFGSRKTSVRAGYGIFYDVPRFHELSHFVNSPPYSLQVMVNQPKSFSDPFAGRVNPFPYAPPQTAQEKAAYTFLLPVTVGLSVDPNLAAAYNQQWNVNIQREIARDMTITAAYVGSKTSRLPIRTELNPALFRAGATTGNIDSRRIYAPNFASIISYASVINSSYEALQLSLNRRFRKGFTVLVHYTYGKTLDGSSIDTDGFPGQNPLDLRSDKGLADFDVRQRFVASYLWELPSRGRGAAKWILGGWQTNGIFTAQSGVPFTVTSGQDRALSGTGTQRPNLTGNPFLDAGRSRDERMQRYFNPDAFALPSSGSYGNAGRNIMIGPGRWNLDCALFKSVPIREHMKLQLRWELFNAFNHANLLNPRANIGAARVGAIDSTTDPRIMQAGARVTF
jgi:outer membrane receptor protein involved in Fe transport